MQWLAAQNRYTRTCLRIQNLMEPYIFKKKIGYVATKPSKHCLECLNQKKCVIKRNMLTAQDLYCCAR